MEKRPLDFFGPDDYDGSEHPDVTASRIKTAQVEWDATNRCGMGRVAVLFLAVRVLVVVLGLGTMYWEGLTHDAPGVWFVVGCTLIALAVVPYSWESKK